MIFYSLGSALGAITTTSVFAGAGWTGSSILGAAFAACALVIWASTRRVAANPRSRPRHAADATTDTPSPAIPVQVGRTGPSDQQA